jgi:hypothetical protein
MSTEYKFKIEDLNLNKKYPGYFKKWIFRGAILLMMLIFVWILYLEDFNLSNSNNLYIKCNSPYACKNPLYECKHEQTDIINCKQLLSLEAPADLYDTEFIMPGSDIGRPPKYAHVPLLYFGITAGAFLFNHALYLISKRRKK